MEKMLTVCLLAQPLQSTYQKRHFVKISCCMIFKFHIYHTFPGQQESYLQLQTPQENSRPLWTMLDHFGPSISDQFGPYWSSWTKFEPYYTVLDHFEKCSTYFFFYRFGKILTIFDRFREVLDKYGPFLTMLDYFYHFRPFWTVCDSFGQCLYILGCLRPFQTILDHCGSFQTILDHCRPLLAPANIIYFFNIKYLYIRLHSEHPGGH